MIQLLWKIIQWFLIKLNIFLPYDPVIVFLSIYPNEFKTYIYTKTYTRKKKKTYTRVFIAALFIFAKT